MDHPQLSCGAEMGITPVLHAPRHSVPGWFTGSSGLPAPPMRTGQWFERSTAVFGPSVCMRDSRQRCCLFDFVSFGGYQRGAGRSRIGQV